MVPNPRCDALCPPHHCGSMCRGGAGGTPGEAGGVHLPQGVRDGGRVAVGGGARGGLAEGGRGGWQRRGAGCHGLRVGLRGRCAHGRTAAHLHGVFEWRMACTVSTAVGEGHDLRTARRLRRRGVSLLLLCVCVCVAGQGGDGDHGLHSGAREGLGRYAILPYDYESFIVSTRVDFHYLSGSDVVGACARSGVARCGVRVESMQSASIVGDTGLSSRWLRPAGPKP